MPDRVGMDFIYPCLFSHRFSEFFQVSDLDPQGHKPRRDLSLAVTAVRIHFHTHEANDPADAQIGERHLDARQICGQRLSGRLSPLMGSDWDALWRLMTGGWLRPLATFSHLIKEPLLPVTLRRGALFGFAAENLVA